MSANLYSEETSQGRLGETASSALHPKPGDIDNLAQLVITPQSVNNSTFKLCCGCEIRASCTLDEIQKNDPKWGSRSFSVLEYWVLTSPRESLNAYGRWKQHPAIEARARDLSVKKTDLKESANIPVCRRIIISILFDAKIYMFDRLWWRGRCKDGDKCPRRHAFHNDEERIRFEELGRKTDGMREKELSAVADDPLLHIAAGKAKKARSDEARPTLHPDCICYLCISVTMFATDITADHRRNRPWPTNELSARGLYPPPRDDRGPTRPRAMTRVRWMKDS